MTDCFESARVCSLLTRALQEVAKLCWGDFVLKWPTTDAPCVDAPGREQDKEIKHHRATVVKRISETFTESTLPKTIKDQLIDAVIHFQRGYLEALSLTAKHRILYSLDTSDILKDGPYSAKNFINPTTGYFDELSWAKRVCDDGNAPVSKRFELACFYCLELRLRALWCHPMCHERYDRVDFGPLSRSRGYFVAVWVYWLGNKFDQVLQEEKEFADGFYVGGFRKALQEQNEFASRYFWAGYSGMEKANVMDEINRYLKHGHLADLADTYCTGLVHFIYSLLNTAEKRDMISYSIENKDFNVWCCLLSSPFYKSVLNDMITLPFPTANKTYVLIVKNFTSKMVEFPLSDHKNTFRVLWKPLSQEQREEVLKISKHFIKKMIDLGDMDLLEMVVQSLSPAVKGRMLLSDWRRSGKSALHRLYETVDDDDAMLRYLRLFLVNRDPATNRWSLRKDAADLLHQFSNTCSFFVCPDGDIPDHSEGPEVKEAIENLEGTLQVLHDLLDRVEKEIHGDGTGFSVIEMKRVVQFL